MLHLFLFLQHTVQSRPNASAMNSTAPSNESASGAGIGVESPNRLDLEGAISFLGLDPTMTHFFPPELGEFGAVSVLTDGKKAYTFTIKRTKKGEEVNFLFFERVDTQHSSVCSTMIRQRSARFLGQSSLTLWTIPKVPPYIRERKGPAWLYDTNKYRRKVIEMTRDFNSTSDPDHPGLRVRSLTLLTLQSDGCTESERSIFKDCVATALGVLAEEDQSLNGSGAT